MHKDLKQNETQKKIIELLKLEPSISPPPFKEEYFFQILSEKEEYSFSQFSINTYAIIASILFIFIIGFFLYNTYIWKPKNLTTFMLEKYKEKKGYNQTAISGIIININGDVWIKKKNKSEQKVFIGNLIEIEDLIQTSDDSFVDIMFEDRFQIRVLSNSSLQINLQNQVWHIKQNFGRAVYMVKKGIDVPLLVEASSFLVRVVGTFFYVENEKDLLVEVVEGTVEILKHDPNTKEIQYLDKLDKHEQILFESKREEFQKKVSKNSELVVIFSEMSKQAEIYNNDEIWESLSKIPNIKDKKEIETLYNRTLEKIKLIDDRIVEGIIVSQHGDIVILHTTDGVKVIELDKIKEIIYEHTQ